MSSRAHLPRRSRPGIKKHVRGDAGWRVRQARLGRPPNVEHAGRVTHPTLVTGPAAGGRRRRLWSRR